MNRKNSLFVIAYSALLRWRMKRSQSSGVSMGSSFGTLAPLRRFCQSGCASASMPALIALTVSVCTMFPTWAKAQQVSYSYTFVAAASNNLQQITGFTSAKVTGAHCDTIANAAAVYLHFYSGQPTMGTTNDVDAVSVPAASSTSGNGRESPTMRDIVYPNGIWVALTGGIGRNDNTSVASGVGRCTIYFRG